VETAEESTLRRIQRDLFSPDLPAFDSAFTAPLSIPGMGIHALSGLSKKALSMILIIEVEIYDD
jgi:hypothetical protein